MHESRRTDGDALRLFPSRLRFPTVRGTSGTSVGTAEPLAKRSKRLCRRRRYSSSLRTTQVLEFIKEWAASTGTYLRRPSAFASASSSRRCANVMLANRSCQSWKQRGRRGGDEREGVGGWLGGNRVRRESRLGGGGDRGVHGSLRMRIVMSGSGKL